VTRQSSTIFALSSGSVPSGVAVVRLSGPLVRFALETMLGFVAEPRVARLAEIRGKAGDTLDRGLVLFFAAPASFTGEDVAELHLHGGRAVVAAVMDRLSELGLHAAEAGEFTRRAFVNGKLDLTEAEALGDLIEAETDAQRRLALRNADGAQRRLYDGWRERILNARAMIEAELDFSDEGDVPGSVPAAVWADMAELAREVGAHLDRLHDGEIVRDGYKVVLAGAPNVGKSSLLNRLAGRDAAIVTAEPGTTRDVIEVALDLGGVKVRLFDTAGLRDDAGMAERIGIERARQAASEADLLLLLLEDSESADGVRLAPGAEVLKVRSKADLTGGELGQELRVSSVTGQGIDELLRLVREKAAARSQLALESVVPTRLRHADALRELAARLAEGLEQWRALELRAEGLRGAGDALARLTGSIHTEDVLGVIFSRFCIGK
jgi:tRNA modification GTPase